MEIDKILQEQYKTILKPDIVFFGEKLPDKFTDFVDDDC